MSTDRRGTDAGGAAKASALSSDVLLELLDEISQAKRKAIQGISRRNFLAASGAGAVTIATTAAAAPLVGPDPGPSFTKSGRILTGHYRDSTWTIDEARFGRGANVRANVVQDQIFVRLTGARMPGSSLAMDFTARIWNAGNVWRISLIFAGQKSDAELGNFESPTLASWFAGEQSLSYLQRRPLELGRARITHAKSAGLLLDIDKTLQPRIAQPIAVTLDGVRFTAAGMRMADGPPSALLGAFTGLKDIPAASMASFDGTMLTSPGIPVSRIATGQSVHWLGGTSPVLRLEAFTHNGRNDALMTIGGEGALALAGRGFRTAGVRVPLQKSVVVALTSSARMRMSLAYAIARKPFLIETSANAVQFSGDGMSVVEHVRGQVRTNWSFLLHIVRAHLPVRGASFAAVDMFSSPGEFVVGPGPVARQTAAEKIDAPVLEAIQSEVGVAPEPHEPPTATSPCAAGSARLRVAQEVELDLPLDAASLVLKRSADLFDMRFEFRNYQLMMRRGTVSLRRRWAYEAACEVVPNPPTLIAVFPPQHEQEEVFRRPIKAPGQETPDMPEGPSEKTRSLDQLVAPHDLARTVVSGPTRIVLRSEQPVKDSDGQDGFELTIENITDWHDLALVVHERALPKDAPLTTQLAASGLKPDMTRHNARHALAAGLIKPLDPDVTAIEPVTGLIVSPDSSAWFDVPRKAPNAKGPNAIWSARLLLGAQSAVRAIKAPGASFDFMSVSCTNETELQNFRSSLDMSDRAELVMLMSGYGLPSLRRLQRDKDEGAVFKDDPAGMVVRPNLPLKFLSDEALDYPIPGGSGKTVRVKQEGILLPRPYADFDLTLTSLKATLNSRWSGEPPAPITKDPFFYRALNIEGYIHRTAGGRDALVQVAYKGFLFPLGHRAALIKVSERPFLPEHWNADYLDPTAYLVQRSFIVCRKPRKTFPALGQPDMGRAFQAANVELVTTVTPDILNVDDLAYKDQRIVLPDTQDLPEKKREPADPKCTQESGRPPPVGVGRVFWPRTRPARRESEGGNAYGHEVVFDWKIDGSPALVRSPLVFVDNAAAHDPQTMQALVTYYDQLAFQAPLDEPVADSVDAARRALRMATMTGVERKYAPANKAGETSFRTASWVLGASGGVGADSLPPPEPTTVLKKLQSMLPQEQAQEVFQESFTMDALMEGADQPPFYPRMHRAFINMQALDRMLGKPQGLIEVGFSAKFIDFGMDRAHNPSEIYLDVLRPAVDLDVSDQGPSSGGIAKPNARLAAIGRLTTMIGGRAKAEGAERLASRRTPIAISTTRRQRHSGVSPLELTFDTRAAQAGQFDAAEFLGGALSEARLLGIIPLREVIKVVAIGLAPKLQETVQYAAEGLGDTVRDAVRAMGAGIDDAIRRGNELALKSLNLPQGDPLGEFYPVLATRLRSFQEVCMRIGALGDQQLKDRFQGFASELVSSGRDVVYELQELAANPLPEGLAEYLEKLRQARDALKAIESPEGLRKFILDELKTPARNLLAQMLAGLATPTETTSPDSQPLDSAFDIMFGISAEGIKANVPAVEAKRKLIIQEILDHPTDALERLKQGLFAQALRPLLEAWAKAGELEVSLKSRLSLSRHALTQEIASCLGLGNPSLAQQQQIQAAAARAFQSIERAVNDVDIRKLLSGSIESARTFMAEKVKDARLDQVVTEVETIYASVIVAREAELKNEVQSQINDWETKAANSMLTLKEREEAEAFLLGLYARRSQIMEILVLLAKPKGVLERIEEAAREEAKRQLDVFAQQLRSEAEDFLNRAVAQVTSAVEGILAAAGKTASLLRAKALDQALGWCRVTTGKSDVGDLLVAVADLLLKSKSEIDKALGNARAVGGALAQITLPGGLPPELRADFQSRLTTMRRSTTQAVEALDVMSAGAPALREQLADPCKSLAKSLNLLGQQFEQRQRALIATLEATLEMARWTVSATSAPQRLASAGRKRTFAAMPGIPDICEHVKVLAGTLRELIAFDDAAFLNKVRAPLASVDKALDRAPDTSAESLVGAADALKKGMTDLVGQVDRCASLCVTEVQKARELVALLEGLRGSVSLYLERMERGLAGEIAQALVSRLIPDRAFEALQTATLDMVRTVKPVLTIYESLVKSGGGTIDKLIDSLTSAALQTGPLAELLALVGRPGIEALKRARKLLEQDQKLLSSIRQAADASPVNLTVVADQITVLGKAWSTGRPGIVEAVEILARMVQSLMKGQFSAFFDLGSLRTLIEEQILSLLPSRIQQSYAWDTRLDDFPASDPIFKMDRSRDSIESMANDLVLWARIDVDLVKKTRSATASGKLRPFNIRLLGDRLDLVTIKFKGASFSAGTGKEPEYQADIEGVEIGAMLEFIKALQQFFSPGEGNGPYVALQLFPPEIQAGYRYSAPFIPVGSLLIMNVAISVSMNLPFDNRQAYFKFAFASRDLPFLISQPPYGGGGFVGLMATAKGIVGFEIQFEFGAVVGIKFGPLQAQGRVTAGIYLMSGEGTQVLEGFVNAVGEGNIACFGVSVNISVRVRQVNGGAMVGSSSYSFSFKVGFVSVKYSFTAQYKVQGGGGGKTNSKRLRDDKNDMNITTVEPKGLQNTQEQFICTTVPRKERNWQSYRKHFVV